MRFLSAILSILLSLCIVINVNAQNFDPGDIPADSWNNVLKQKKGTISTLWYDIEPFIYRTNNTNTGMAGVEYELMESFVNYIRNKYQVDLKLEWVDAQSFESIYPYIAKTKRSGVFGWSYYSITSERKKDVKFTPAYMPDVNIIVTDIAQPLYASNQDFIKSLPGKAAFTMGSTMMEQDVLTIKQNFYKSLQVHKEFDDYAVMEKISRHPNSFGYVPLSIYVMALQRGIKVKRQDVLPTRREGFAGIYSKASDWDAPVNEYFSSNAFTTFAATVIKKYLGSDVSDLIFKASLPDSLRSAQNDKEMLTLEKEIVSKNLVISDEKIQQQKIIRNTIIAAAFVILLLMLVLYSMYASKQKYAKVLQQRNDVIIKQNQEIEMMMRKLEMKVMLAEINPHLVFNSLNAIQYFVSLDDKKNALKYLASFSKHLRLMLGNAGQLTVSVEKEINMLKQYLELERLRFENKFSYSIEMQPASDLFVEIPSMLIQPVVETALYNQVLAINETEAFINISFARDGNLLLVYVHYNNPYPDKAEKALEQDDILYSGLKRLLERIELLNFDKAEKITIKRTITTADTATVTITIPVNN